MSSLSDARDGQVEAVRRDIAHYRLFLRYAAACVVRAVETIEAGAPIVASEILRDLWIELESEIDDLDGRV
jgi:hypothetical protein